MLKSVTSERQANFTLDFVVEVLIAGKMSVFMSNVDLLKSLVECLKQISSEWGLDLKENEAINPTLKVYTCSIRTRQDTKDFVRVNAVLVFDDQIMIYAKVDRVCRTVNFNVNDYMKGAPDSDVVTIGRLSSKLIATIFAPFFRPNKEYQNLSQISAVASTHICSHLSATELCRLAQTNQSFRSTASTNEVWSKLLTTDFPTTKQTTTSHSYRTTNLTTDNNGTNSGGSAKAQYKEMFLLRAIECRNHRAAELRYLEALEQELRYVEQMRAESFPVFAPDLVLPPLRLGVSGIDNSPSFLLPPFHRDTHDTWF